MKIAGLDIGTTGCKCTVFDESGHCLGKSYRDYPVNRKNNGHEVEVSSIMEGVYEVIAEMAGRYPDISGLGVTSFGETFVMTDGSGQPLHNAMLYTDPRGKEECRQLVEMMGGKEIARITGVRPHEMYSISKLMWLKKYQPEIYEQAAYIFLMEDYVVYHLTGKRRIDYSLASRTMAFDITKLGWSEQIFRTAGIDINKMSQPVPTGTIAGEVTMAAVVRTGLAPETRIVSVSHDQVAAAVGAGAFDSSVAVDGAGTVECLTPVFDEMPEFDVMYEGHFAIVPYVTPGKYVAYAFSYTGGALIQWCTEALAKKETELAAMQGISVNEYLEQAYHSQFADDWERPTGLLVLPHFAGAATPYMDTGSKGAILGLTTDTTAADIYRACMEGVVYEMYVNAMALPVTGRRFTRMNATGGGAHSKDWMQMKADVLNVPMVALKTVDAGTVGGSMLTGVAIGIYKDLEEAAACMVEETEIYQPRQVMHERYMEVFKRYEKVYQAVRALTP